MNRRYFLKTTGLTSLAAATHACTEADLEPQRPNILFIMTDQQFAEIMSCRMGNQYIHTPNMDQLAEEGMLFSRAYTANPLCMPARASIFTGRYPHETTVQKNGDRMKVGEFPCIGAIFKNAGYDTGYFGKWHLSYDKDDAAIHGFNETGVLYGNGHDEAIPAPAIAFLNRPRENPFLLVASFSNPHDVCQLARHEPLPSGPIGEAPPLQERPPLRANSLPPENETDIMTLMRKSYHASPTFPVGDYDEDTWRRLIWGYYRLTEKVDALIGKVLNALKASGQEENTLIVLTSEHGDCHGAHQFNQKTVFYDESSRVPFILKYRDVITKGTTDRLINTGIDIAPTLFDYAGIEQAPELPGRSLRGIAEGREPSSWREYVVVQNLMVQGGPVDGVPPIVNGRMVRSERYKYCLYDQGQRRESLVDMAEDPGEMHNIAYDPANREILNQHRAHLKEHAERYKDQLAMAMLAGLQGDRTGGEI